MLEKLEALKGQFWTDLDELVEEIEEKGFYVDELNQEYVTVWTNEEENEDSSEWVNNPVFAIYLIKAGATYVIDSIEEV